MRYKRALQLRSPGGAVLEDQQFSGHISPYSDFPGVYDFIKLRIDAVQLPSRARYPLDVAFRRAHRLYLDLGVPVGESIEKMREKGYDAKNGDFAENLTIKGILLWELKPGDVLKVGGEVILKITRIGKICHQRCNIFYQVGDCVMPREGVFAEVVNGGIVKPGDSVILDDSMTGSVSA